MNINKLNQSISKLSKKELAEIFPPIQRNNFVVRNNWLGRNQIITFINNKHEMITYNHDEVLKVMLPKLKLMPCWIKRGYWSQSTDVPSNTRDSVIERVDLTEQSAPRSQGVTLFSPDKIKLNHCTTVYSNTVCIAFR